MIFNTCFWTFGNLHRVSECKLLLCLFNVPVAFFSQYNSFPHLPQIACFACFPPLSDILVCYGINTWNGSGSDSTWMRVMYLSSSSLTGSGSIGSIESCPLQISGYWPQHWLISQDNAGHTVLDHHSDGHHWIVKYVSIQGSLGRGTDSISGGLLRWPDDIIVYSVLLISCCVMYNRGGESRRIAANT